MTMKFAIGKTNEWHVIYRIYCESSYTVFVLGKKILICIAKLF